MTRDLTIGRMARLAGVNVETVRYYQRRGLLEEPKKPLDGYRRYVGLGVLSYNLHVIGRELLARQRAQAQPLRLAA